MDLVLRRKTKKETGIYGELSTTDGKFVAKTLEHAYKNLNNREADQAGVAPPFVAIIPHGTFRCARGNHALHDGLRFETFMVTKVPGHTGILFHIGNYNRDSEGCILLGLEEIPEGVGKSGDAFKHFIELQKGVNEFYLTVEG